MRAKIQISLVLLFLVTIVMGQEKYEDKIIRRDGKIVNCKVREIGDDEIKYSEEGMPGDVLIGMDKNKVASIVFADGREMKMADSMTSSVNYATQRKNALKVNAFLPISGAFELAYERSLVPGRSFESSLGIIYSGIDQGEGGSDMDASGVFFKAGYKFIRDPDFYLKGMRYAHILKGGYVKPELAFTTFSFNSWDASGQTTANHRESMVRFAVLLNLGKQVVFDNRFLFDWFIGAGYMLGGTEGTYRYFAFIGDETSSFIMTGGIRIGLLF
jgi:hypothetical protein